MDTKVKTALPATHRRRAKKAPTLDERRDAQGDDAHRVVTAETCNGHAGPYCKLLASALHDEVNCRRAGLTVMYTVHWKTNPNGNHIGVALKLPGRDALLALDYCPWCGANIRAVILREIHEASCNAGYSPRACSVRGPQTPSATSPACAW